MQNSRNDPILWNYKPYQYHQHKEEFFLLEYFSKTNPKNILNSKFRINCRLQSVAHLNYSLIDLVRFWYLLNIVFEHNTQLPSRVFVTWIAFWTSGLFIKSRISLSLVQEGVSLSFLLANILSLTLLGKLSIKNDLKCCIDPEDSQSRFCYHQDFQCSYLDKYYKYWVHPSIIVK